MNFTGGTINLNPNPAPNTPNRTWTVLFEDFTDTAGTRKSRCFYKLSSPATVPGPLLVPYFYIKSWNLFLNERHLRCLLGRTTDGYDPLLYSDVLTPHGETVTKKLTQKLKRADAYELFIEDKDGTDARVVLATAGRPYEEVPGQAIRGIEGLWTGFALDMPPTTDNYAPGEKYFKLRKKDLLSIDNTGGWDSPDAAYIPEKEYLAVQAAAPAQTRSPRIAVRDGYGQSVWVIVNRHITDPKDKDLWKGWYNRATLASEKETYKTRHINPQIDLVIHPGGTGRLTVPQLTTIFNEAVKKGAQGFTISTDAPDPNTYVMIGLSPFGDYETWILKTMYDTYLAAYKDREMPKTLAEVKSMVDLLQKTPEERKAPGFMSEPHYVTTITSAKVTNAVGKRDTLEPELKQQGTVMGGSATDLAVKLNWTGAKDLVPGANPKWPPTGVYPAEWLHLSAFSWGGFGSSNDWRSSQNHHNLIFGTSETNSLMTRYEKAWQTLVTREQDLRSTYFPGLPLLSWELHTTTRGLPYSTTNPVATELWPNQPDPSEDHWSNLAVGAKATWLCYSLKYELVMNEPSRVVYPGSTAYQTMFYPFQRPFFTAIETAADKKILQYFVKRAELFAGGDVMKGGGKKTVRGRTGKGGGKGGDGRRGGRKGNKEEQKDNESSDDDSDEEPEETKYGQKLKNKKAQQHARKRHIVGGDLLSDDDDDDDRAIEVEDEGDKGGQQRRSKRNKEKNDKLQDQSPIFDSDDEGDDGSEMGGGRGGAKPVGDVIKKVKPSLASRDEEEEGGEDGSENMFANSFSFRGGGHARMRGLEVDWEQLQMRAVPVEEEEEVQPETVQYNLEIVDSAETEFERLSRNEGPPPWQQIGNVYDDAELEEAPEQQFERLSRNFGPPIGQEPSQVRDGLGFALVVETETPEMEFARLSRNFGPPIGQEPSQARDDPGLAPSPELVPAYTSEVSPPSYEQLWAALVVGNGGTLVVDGQTFENPCLAIVDDEKKEVVDVRPELVGLDNKGQAVVLSEEEAEAIAEASELEEAVLEEVSVGGSFGAASGVSWGEEAEDQIKPLNVEYSYMAANSFVLEPLPAPVKVEVPIPSAPPGFVLSREIKLFGGNLTARLYTAYGSEVTRDNERLEIVEDLSLGYLIPALAGSDMDMVKISKTVITYSNKMTETQLPGLMLRTEVRLAGALEPVNDLLRDVFGQKDPCISVAGMISMNRDWEELLRPIGFTLRSELKNMSMTLFDCVEIINLGIDVIGTRTVKPVKDGVERGYALGFGLFGQAAVKLSGAPLMVEWYLMKMQELYSMRLKLQDEDWKDVLGVKGLILRNVCFSASFVSSIGLSSVALGISASLTIRKGTIALTGSYSKNNWAISASLGNLTFEDISDIYEDLFGSRLAPTSHTILFNSISFVVGSNGLCLQGQVTVDDHSSASARIAIGPQGIEIAGAVEDVNVPGGIVKIQSASLDVAIGRSSPGGRELKIAISGDVTVKGNHFAAGIYYKKTPEGETEYTLYGVYEGDLHLRSLVPDLKDSFMDIAVEKVALIASNQKDPVIEGVKDKFPYKIKKGVQICATIKSLKQIDDLTKGDRRELTLSAAWSKGDSFSFDIAIPTKDMIKFNDNVTSGDLELGVVISKDVQIRIKSGLFIKVAKRKTPLNLQLELLAGMYSAEGTALMHDMWEDPWGLGDDIQIGNFLVTIGINYTQFCSSGLISKFVLGGRIIAGKTEGKMLLQMSTTRPDEQLISASFKNLDLGNLIVLCSKLTPWPIDTPSDAQILKFNTLNLYLSTGVNIQGQDYPAGASFHADMVIMGKNAIVTATIGKTFKIFGTIDPFEIGGLTIRGKTQAKPVIDITIEQGKQYVKIDGGVYFAENEASIVLEIQIMPSIIFSFDLTVKFVNALDLQLKAKLINGDKDKPKDMDFMLEAYLQSNLLQELIRMANDQVHQAQAGNRLADLDRRLNNAKERQGTAWRRYYDHAFEVEKDVAQALGALAEEEITLSENRLATDRRYKARTGELEKEITEKKKWLEVKLEEKKKEQWQEEQNAEEKLRRLNEERRECEWSMKQRWGDVPVLLAISKSELDATDNKLQEYDRQIQWQQDQVKRAGFWGKAIEVWKLERMHIARLGLSGAYSASYVYWKRISAITQNDEYIAAQERIAQAVQSVHEQQWRSKREAQDIAEEIDRLGFEKKRAAEEGQRSLENLSTNSDLLRARDKAENELADFQRSAGREREMLRLKQQSLQSCPERKELEFAMQELTNAEVARESYDPLLAGILEIADDVTDVLGGLLKKFAGEVVDIKSVHVKGSLKGVMNGEPLKARVVVVVAGVEAPLEMKYYLADALNFLTQLWEQIKLILKNRFSISF